MWLVTALGFFSLTEVPGKPDTMQLRARRRIDLDVFHTALAEEREIRLPKHDEAYQESRSIIFTSGSDYRWRIVFPKTFLPVVMKTFERSVAYDNFKDHVARLPTQMEKIDDLHDIWSITRRWQNSEHSPNGADTKRYAPRPITPDLMKRLPRR